MKTQDWLWLALAVVGAVAAWLVYANGATSGGSWSLATAFSNGNIAGT
jgi:tryptophan-rich sensory protein